MRYLGSFWEGFPICVGALHFVGCEEMGFRLSGVQYKVEASRNLIRGLRLEHQGI